MEAPRISNSRRFFIRGLGIVLPTLLTIWILVTVYNFLDQKIAEPINRGVRHLVLHATPWPRVDREDVDEVHRTMSPEQQRLWAATGHSQDWLEFQARRDRLREGWERVTVGEWAVLDVIGLLVAVALIYMVGLLLGGYLGHQIYRRGEEVIRRVPFFKQVYPYVKQVTDFVFGEEDEKMRFNQVVAVEYPRKGLWSIGLVTGNTMRTIQERAPGRCVTIFVPSSPTPFTGYVITVPVSDTIELPISIEEALRFTVSGGVVVPDGEVIQAEDLAKRALAGGGVAPATPPEATGRRKEHEKAR